MTVDPGLGGTGWAVWSPSLHPESVGCIQTHGPQNKLDWLQRAEIITNEFSRLLYSYEETILVTNIYIEYPQLHTTSGGMASAVRGDVFKLMFLVGAFARVCWQYNKKFYPLEVNTWKGTMPKEVVARRVARKLHVTEKHFPNHTMDAVGMGLYLKGMLTTNYETRPIN